jgi:hypothetical protein
MSGYNGRHGPNVSKYVANLNTIPTQQDLLAEPLNIEEDLALFTNNDFIDWNENDNLNTSLDFLETEQQQRPSRQHAVTSHISAADEPKMDYPMTGKCPACHYVSVYRSHIVFIASVSSFNAPSLYRLPHWLGPGYSGPRQMACIAPSLPTPAGHSQHYRTARHALLHPEGVSRCP